MARHDSTVRHPPISTVGAVLLALVAGVSAAGAQVPLGLSPTVFACLLWNWFIGAAPQHVVHPFMPGLAAASYCP